MASTGTITVMLIVLTAWLIAVSIFLARMMGRYRRLTSGIKKRDLRELLEHASEKLNEQNASIENLQETLNLLKKDEEDHLQKIGFLRFNPFVDTGGDQSFCLAILDRHNNGIVISSLHSRDQTRLYAKKVLTGKSEGQELSKEEKEAVIRAQKS